MNLLFLLCLALPACLVPPCWADEAAQHGLQIALEADRRASGFGDFTADFKMILRNKEGDESERSMRLAAMEWHNDGDRTLIVFHTPKDVQGTALLTHAHKFSDDDQWLFLPALRRIKRISSRNKSGSFMGSEFSYEDLGGQEVEKYTYRFIGEQTHEGIICFVIERYPKDAEHSGYSKIITWIDQDAYRIRQERYFDKKGKLLKTLQLHDYRLYEKQFWRCHFMHMVNRQNGKQTDLIWSNYLFATCLTEHDFHHNRLLQAK